MPIRGNVPSDVASRLAVENALNETMAIVKSVTTGTARVAIANSRRLTIEPHSHEDTVWI